MMIPIIIHIIKYISDYICYLLMIKNTSRTYRQDDAPTMSRIRHHVPEYWGEMLQAILLAMSSSRHQRIEGVILVQGVG